MLVNWSVSIGDMDFIDAALSNGILHFDLNRQLQFEGGFVRAFDVEEVPPRVSNSYYPCRMKSCSV